MRWLCICWIALLSTGVAQASGEDAALQSALDSYPTRRYLTGGLDAILGGVTGIGGLMLSLDSTKPGDEVVVGLVGTVAGSLIGLDGLIRIFHPTPLEWEYPFYKKMPAKGDRIWKSRSEYGRALLENNSQRARTTRYLRAAGGLLSSALHLYLFQKGQDRYQYLVYPGAAMGVMALYRLFFYSPEEAAWAEYRAKQPSAWSLELLPTGIALRF